MQLNKLKSEIKYGTKVTLKLSSNVVGDYKDEKNFPINCYRLTHKFRYLSKCANVSSTNIKSLKTHLHKTGQSGGFLGRLLKN